MAEVPVASGLFYDTLVAIRRDASAKAHRAWLEMSGDHLSLSWARLRPIILPMLVRAQVEAAYAGSTYGAFALAEQGAWQAPEAFVDPAAFGGWSSSGADLGGTLDYAVVDTKEAIRGGASVAQALDVGWSTLSSIVGLQVSDAGRVSAGVDVTTRKGVGYVRMLNPPSCSRCVVLAGKFFRWNAGFRRHPQCFPAGVVVSGPASEGATRRWYEGELVVLTTASGKDLPLTGNHPVLTRRGWVPANLLQEGDEVVRSTRPEGATPLVVPDHHQVPALVEDVWGSLAVDGLDRVPSSPEDFHGDGQGGQVDVVQADRALSYGLDPTFSEHLREHALAGGIVLPIAFDAQRPPVLFDLRDSAHPGGTVGGRGLPLPFRGRHPLVAHSAGLAHAAALNAGMHKDPRDRTARDAVLLGESVLAGAGQVLLDDLLGGQSADLPRWDAPAGPLSVDTRDGYASQGSDLLERLSGQVELDRIVKLSRTEFRGHVYSLTSVEGWHVANSLIVSNCDCVHTPSAAGSLEGARSEGLVDDPYDYFRGLSKTEQDKAFGKAQAAAIRDGGDIYQVINSSRGRKGAFTTEGTTRRGYASTQLGPRQRRMTPETIYRLNPKREDAIQALKDQGYILPGGQVPGGSLRGRVEGFGQMGRGGTRKAASQAILEARRTGVRDPSSRYTMTAAERRLHDAEQRYRSVLQGINPYSSPGFGNRPDPTGALRGYGRSTADGTRGLPLTPEIAARVEAEYRLWLSSGGQIF